jgi:hypothetical protein
MRFPLEKIKRLAYIREKGKILWFTPAFDDSVHLQWLCLSEKRRQSQVEITHPMKNPSNHQKLRRAMMTENSTPACHEEGDPYTALVKSGRQSGARICRREWMIICTVICVRGPRWSTGTSFVRGSIANQSHSTCVEQRNLVRSSSNWRCGSWKLLKERSYKVCACSPARDRKAGDSGMLIAEDPLSGRRVQPTSRGPSAPRRPDGRGFSDGTRGCRAEQ